MDSWYIFHVRCTDIEKKVTGLVALHASKIWEFRAGKYEREVRYLEQHGGWVRKTVLPFLPAKILVSSVSGSNHLSEEFVAEEQCQKEAVTGISKFCFYTMTDFSGI